MLSLFSGTSWLIPAGPSNTACVDEGSELGSGSSWDGGIDTVRRAAEARQADSRPAASANRRILYVKAGLKLDV